MPFIGVAKDKAATENQHKKMQNYCKTIGALAAASALVAGNAQAEVEYQLHAGYSTEYIFRGVELGDDLVESGFDVATEVGGINLSGGVWYANYQAPEDFRKSSDTEINVNEIDLYAEAAKDLGFAKFRVGYIYYYNDTDKFTTDVFGKKGDTQEVYFGASRDLGFATLALTYYWDIVGDNDGYTELGLTRSFELSPCLNLNVASNVGYLVENGDFTAWSNKVSLDWGFAEKAKLSPFVAYTVALSDENNTSYHSSENEFTVGSMISVSF